MTLRKNRSSLSKPPLQPATPASCLTCKHWMPKQAELEYSKSYGICTVFKLKFDLNSDYDDVMLLDRKNISDKHLGVRRFENVSNVVPIGKKEESQYCLVTGKNFKCMHYNK